MVKTTLILSLVVAAYVQAAAASAKPAQKRQLVWKGPGGKFPDPPNAAPRRQVSKSSMETLGVQQVKIRYQLSIELLSRS
jgi:hypothetical protein